MVTSTNVTERFVFPCEQCGHQTRNGDCLGGRFKHVLLGELTHWCLGGLAPVPACTLRRARTLGVPLNRTNYYGEITLRRVRRAPNSRLCLASLEDLRSIALDAKEDVGIGSRQYVLATASADAAERVRAGAPWWLAWEAASERVPPDWRPSLWTRLTMAQERKVRAR